MSYQAVTAAAAATSSGDGFSSLGVAATDAEGLRAMRVETYCEGQPAFANRY